MLNIGAIGQKLRAIAQKVAAALRPFAWLMVGLAALTLAWFLLPDYSRVSSPSQTCPDPVEPSPQPRLAEGVAPVPLVLERAEGVMIDLWRDRASRNKTVFLQVAKKTLPQGDTRFAVLGRQTSFTVSKRALERQELDGNIGPVQYVAIAQVTARKEVGLTICVDPAKFDVDPGTYTGSVRIASRVIQPITVPVTVTLQYSGYRWIVPLTGVLAFLAGSFVVWASGKKAQNAAPTSTVNATVWQDVSELPSWILDNYVGVAAGVIAATSVFIAKYWRSPPWGARAPEDWLALLGSIFTAYTASLTAASALVPPRGRAGAGPRGQPRPDGIQSAPDLHGTARGSSEGGRFPQDHDAGT